MSEPILAKSRPRLTLREHTEDVVAEAECVLARLRYHVKYKRLVGADLRQRLLQAAVHHDRGKAHPRWQRHLRNGTLRTVRLRHEFDSLRKLDEHEINSPDPVRVAIAAHHNKLSWYHRDRWLESGPDFDSHETYWHAMRDLQREGRRKDRDALVRMRYAYDVVRGLLQLADRRASQIEDPDAPDPLPLRPFRYDFPHDTHKPVQEAALRHANQRVVALRSETGSGKTAAALLWAREQVRNQKARRAIMALPTRFTATSLAADTGEDVLNGLYHSSAWHHLDDDPRRFERLAMARQFLYPLTVTTIDQVLACLTGRREEDHLRFANLAHSCLIIDECDFYDDVVQANIEYLMHVLDVLEVPVLVMSATLPDAHVSIYFPNRDAPPPLDTTTADTAVRIASVRNVEAIGEEAQWLLDVAHGTDRLIVYANTVSRAVAYYRLLSEARDDVILYHSRFTEPHKAEKESAIRSRLGRDGAGGIAVLTQIGEMSLNISAPVMVSELCPMDRLAQRTGRLSRFTDADGTLHLIRPQRNGTLYPAPYGSPTPGHGWTPAPALLDTDTRLARGDVLTKLDLKEQTNAVYATEQTFSEAATANRDQLDAELRKHWLLRPTAEQDEDDPQTAEWQSRIIGPQIEAFVSGEHVADVYDNNRAFQYAHTRFTVSVPTYRLWQYPTLFTTQEVSIQDDVEQVHVLTDPSVYSTNTGLTFP